MNLIEMTTYKMLAYSGVFEIFKFDNQIIRTVVIYSNQKYVI